MSVRPRFIVLFAALLFVGGMRADDGNATAGLRLFEEKIHPILAGTCFRCHGDQKVAGGLRIRLARCLAHWRRLGTAIVPGKPEESLLLKAIRRNDDVSAMPPDKELRQDQVADLAAWIAAGTPWPEQPVHFEAIKHWAFEPVPHADIPAVQNDAWPRNEIDRFLLAKIEANGRQPLPQADRRTLHSACDLRSNRFTADARRGHGVRAR